MPAADDEIDAERLTIDRLDADGVRAVIEDRHVILVRGLRGSCDIVLVCKRVVEVVEHHEGGLFALFARHFLDLLRDSVACDDVILV